MVFSKPIRIAVFTLLSLGCGIQFVAAQPPAPWSEFWVAPPLPPRGVVVMVQPDPLSAYSDRIGQVYPNGVPATERGFALELMRSDRAQLILGTPQFGYPTVPAEGVIPAPPNAVPALPNSTVRKIAVRAEPTSTHGNADWDALTVDVTGFDDAGVVVPLDGTFQATLWGQKIEIVPSYGQNVVAKPLALRQIGTWTRALRGPLGANSIPLPDGSYRVTLPLSNPLPEHNFTLAPFGELNVRLLAPSRGVFSASVANLPLRKSSLIREQQLLDTGSAFFPEEVTRGNRSVNTLRPQLQSELRPDSRVFAVQP